MPARVSVRGADGRSFAPADAWHHADDGFDRAERRFEYGYFHTTGVGHAHACRPAGTRSRSRAARNTGWSPRRSRWRRASNPPLRVALAMLDDLEARGWYSGDLHVHMNYGGAYRNDPTRLAFQARAEDLHVVENLIVNKEGRVPDVAWFRPGPDPASTPGTLIVHGEEYPHQLLGPRRAARAARAPGAPGLHRVRQHRRRQPPADQRSRASTSPGRRARSPATCIPTTPTPTPAIPRAR